jgi:hypothetical protein
VTVERMDVTGLWMCAISCLYQPRPCIPSLVCEHEDIYVGDLLTLADIDDRDLGHELARGRYLSRLEGYR